ncbi:MAG TPA: calcium-binding protein, partial [Nitrosomonas sp.]|nr:calcium-binding protein [Nitrosomonas sp.]
GGAGGDTLDGVAGSDTLTGAAGADIFAFTAALNATTNSDVITDFSVVDDTIRLENAIFTKFTATGALPAGSFISGPGAVALDGNDHLIYNTTTGTLAYDTDGNGAGAQVVFATLTGTPALTQADFVVV